MRDDTLREVEQFLYKEARLLDERRFNEWLALFTEDIRYWMAAKTNRYPKTSKAIHITDPDRYVEDELPRENELVVIDDDKTTLSRRIARLATGFAWGEDPPSRTRHIITNVEVENGEASSELRVLSNFLVYRSRGETEQDFYMGARQDTLRRVGHELKVARRRIMLDQNVILAKNVSIFF